MNNFRFYLDDNNNLHISEKGVNKIYLFEFDEWIEEKNLFENIEDVRNTKTYPYKDFKEVDVDDDLTVIDVLLQEKSLNELKYMQNSYFI